MKKRFTILLIFLVVLTTFLGWYFGGPSKVPAGQQPLLALSTTNFGEFAKAFDDTADGPRLILLLSPT